MKNGHLVTLIILNIVSWTVSGLVAVNVVRTTGNPWWALLLLIPALFGYSYKEHHDN